MLKLSCTAAGLILSAIAVSAATPSRPTPGTKLIVSGEHMVHIVDADKALASGNYRDGVEWSWDAHSIATATGMTTSQLDHISDCKMMSGNRLLVNSSYGWCALIDRATKKLLFYTKATPNAHSATLLPGNLVAVASSSGDGTANNSIHLLRLGTPGVMVASYTLDSAHGALWHDGLKRLFTVGGRTLQAYSLNTSTPALTLDYTVTTALSGTHDLTSITDGKLCVAGKNSYTYDIDQRTFRSMPLFDDHDAVKAVNVNDSTGEMWYTDATEPEGTQTWSTRTIRWASDRTGQATATFKVADMDVYKVRVASWGQ